jgi:hypothetical protein
LRGNETMSGTVSFFSVYVACWVSLCLFAVVLYIKDRNAYSISRQNYWRFLFIRWKVITFLIASTGMTVIAPYTGDPTWDYFDAAFMSVLTFLTAPWSVGTIYKMVKKELPLKQGFVAACLWMFSASWSYDLYILIRDGAYPMTWFANIFASSALYFMAGLLWNLEYRPKRGVIFSFMEADWPTPMPDSDFSKVFWFALPMIVMVAALILVFFLFKY